MCVSFSQGDYVNAILTNQIEYYINKVVGVSILFAYVGAAPELRLGSSTYFFVFCFYLYFSIRSTN